MDGLPGDREVAPGVALAGFYPSLHLNLAEGYRRLGEAEAARRHHAAAEAALAALPDGDYARFLRGALARLADRL